MCGNDFIILTESISGNYALSATVARLADRKIGVGCDQVLVISGRSEDRFYNTEIYNQDGSKSSMCGNGLRCLAQYIFTMNKTEETTIYVEKSPFRCFLSSGVACINVGIPTFNPDKIPMSLADNIFEIEHMKERLTGIGVGIGNPHAVFLVDCEISNFDLRALYESVAKTYIFPAGVNVSVLSRQNGNARIYERGVGETLSCGSGACAIYSAAKSVGLDIEQIRFPGGALSVRTEPDGSLVLSGEEPVFVFSGEWLASNGRD